jgi:Skp family chaperone for outer membrane proteins
MVNLIGLVIGSTLARNADVPAEEVPRFSLLGAVSPSPLLGAVVVNAALAQRERDDDTYLELGTARSRGANLVEQLQQRLRHRHERELEREQVRQREQERERREHRERREAEAFQQVALALAILQQSMAQPRQDVPTFGDAMNGVREALSRLEEVVRYSQRETGEGVSQEGLDPSDR